MALHEFNVTYRVDDDMLKRIDSISKYFFETDSTRDSLFNFIMNCGSEHDIENKVNFFERKLGIDN